MTLGPTSDHRARIDGSAFERLVLSYIEETGLELPDFRVEHRERVAAPDGVYQIDVTARFRQLGVDFLVLVECKDHARPVEREDVQVLVDKKRATGAHKAILFATNGFQLGAVEYAKVHRVALVRIVEGAFVYETRAAQQLDVRPNPPPWADTPEYVGQRIYGDGKAIHVWVIERGHPDALRDYLVSA